MNPLAVTLAVCEAVKAIFTFLCTPAGQRQVEKWIDNQEKFEQDWATIENWFKTTIKLG